MEGIQPTSLLFHHNGELYEHQAVIQACLAYNDLPDSDKQLFKDAPANLHAVIVNETIFHPQGGGQPSDTGTISTSTSASFEVLSARTSTAYPGIVLHFGTFTSGSSSEKAFTPSTPCTLSIDKDKRLLYSKYHTAGHVLGSAVRQLLEKEIPNFDELKASHFPDAAACEFLGSIPGSHKESIQVKLDELIAAALPVEIEWWSEKDFAREGLERLVPDEEVREAMGVPKGGKFRVVRIVGAEVYPCGGTHVKTTELCGKTVVRKIARSKGMSRVAYVLPDE